ncbi:hypothetical protein AA0114_g6283 [Alternaria tenuissima]|uniref:Uncharacterized protein n=1 Tax=Alternaria tenuissima TaxID=119927 RepID=A0A4Q4MHM2_9PLEO|nr:hypothetical protein AA0114_g6283 [Alternaria tenuissima]
MISPLTAREIELWNAYFEYYTTECRKAVETDHGQHVTVRTHEDVITISRHFKEGLTKDTIKRSLTLLDTRNRTEEVKDRMAEGSVRLAVRLFSMVDVGPTSNNWTWSPPSLPWTDEQLDLSAVLANHFVISTKDTGSLIFEDEFSAFNLQRLAGLDIQWTNNLANHLRLIDNDRTLCIFHHATFLQRQNSNLFPPSFIKETLRTLDLLFPRGDVDTKRWIASQQSQDADITRPDTSLTKRDRVPSADRRAVSFHYWRDELLSLKEKFDQPKPTSISQFWYDRRNRSQWYTFWIAVTVLCLTIFFGLVQSIEGALQVYKAYHPT